MKREAVTLRNDFSNGFMGVVFEEEDNYRIVIYSDTARE
jgi:hypothetical protein